MMIRKNVVLINILQNCATGILYPCKNRCAQGNGFLILTNAHVFLDYINFHSNGDEQSVDRPIAQNLDEQIEKNISLTFYDDLGEVVEPKSIHQMKVFVGECTSSSQKDIAAIWIDLDKSVPLSVETSIFDKPLNNRETIYMEGYPGVMCSSEFSKRIQLEGVEKTLFPYNEQVGAYQITDDYHYYGNYCDYDLMQGISGSPVYICRNGKESLVGMNQSVSNIDRGENPFKLVYYLRFTHILKFLRENQCILFHRKTETEYEIEWIYKDQEKGQENIKILAIGGSGSGKSSLARDFMLHGDKMSSTGDGQTTRSDVIYHYSLFESNPHAEIKFMRKNDFAEHMTSLVATKALLLYGRYLWDLPENSILNERDFLVSVYDLLRKIFRIIEENETAREHAETLNNYICLKEIENEYFLKCLQDIFRLFYKKIPVTMMKWLLGDYYISNAPSDGDLENDLVKAFSTHTNEIKTCKEAYRNRHGHEDFSIEKFQELLLENIKSALTEQQEVKKIAFPKLPNTDNHMQEAFQKECKEMLLQIEGFFSITEFYFLSENMEQEIDSLYLETGADAKGVEQGIIRYYKMVYSALQNKINDSFKREGDTLTIPLDNLSEGEAELLKKCLKVSQQGSLTGLIKFVDVYDVISNEYAFIFREMDLESLTLIDTCGLDHININNDVQLKKQLRRHYVHHIQGTDQDNTAILFVKKLDSGKPDELRTILPQIQKEMPKVPVYCLFSGIDIFYRTNEEIDSIYWRKGNTKCPKAVQYIFNEEDAFTNRTVTGGKIIAENGYKVLKNNVIPYCGRKELVEQNFSYYKNNTRYIRQLIVSIAMKEYSSIEILNDNEINIENAPKGAVDKFVFSIFKYASLRAYLVHHQTQKADINSFGADGKLGYCRTYDHYFASLFHIGYVDAVQKESDELIRAFNMEEHAGAFISALCSMENRFLGNENSLYKMEYRDNGEGSKKTLREVLNEEKQKPDIVDSFRKLLEQMYANQMSEESIGCIAISKIKEMAKAERNAPDATFQAESLQIYYDSALYKIKNPFSVFYWPSFKQYLTKVEKGRDSCFWKTEDEFKAKRSQIFHYIFSFDERFDNAGELKNSFGQLFVNTLKEQIQRDNRMKATYLLRINSDFLPLLNRMEREFYEKYSSGSGESMFKELMKFYFDSEKMKEKEQ